MPFKKDALIYLVDDDLVMLEILDRHLELHQYTNVRRFSNGEDMIESLNKAPDLVILDYKLSSDETKLNGYDLFHHLKAKYPETKIVMLSAQEDGELVIKMIKQGLRDYIIKDSHMLNEIAQLLKE